MKRILLRATLTLAVAVCVTYIADTGVVVFRARGNPPGTGAAFGTTTFYYTADLKSHQYEIFEQPQQETCVHAIFPHYGFPPCWYSSRRTIRAVD